MAESQNVYPLWLYKLFGMGTKLTQMLLLGPQWIKLLTQAHNFASYSKTSQFKLLYDFVNH